MSALKFILTLLIMYIGSFLMTSAVAKIVTLFLGITFNWLIPTCAWAILLSAMWIIYYAVMECLDDKEE